MDVAELFTAGVAAAAAEGDAGAIVGDWLFAGAVLFQVFTPPCPAQAPRFDSADVYVPSLHSPVEPAGA
jgi:hypothetical protein